MSFLYLPVEIRHDDWKERVSPPFNGFLSIFFRELPTATIVAVLVHAPSSIHVSHHATPPKIGFIVSPPVLVLAYGNHISYNTPCSKYRVGAGSLGRNSFQRNVGRHLETSFCEPRLFRSILPGFLAVDVTVWR